MEITFELVKELRERGLSWRQIGLYLADHIDADPYLLQERARKKWRRYKSRRKISEGKEVSEISTPLTLSEDMVDLEDEDSLLRLHGYNPESWVVVDSSTTIRANSVNTRVKVRPRQIPLLDEEVLASKLVKSLESIPLRQLPTHPAPLGEDLVVVPLYDLHYGRKGEGHDHEETRVSVLKAVDEIVDRLVIDTPTLIELPIGQDFCNIDTPTGTTTKGTPQDNSLFWYEILSGALALAVEITDRLSAVAPVRVRYSKGNHDQVFAFAIVQALAQRYRHSENVSVITDSHPRQYVEFENNLIGLTHGNEEKNLSMVMQTEQREVWGRNEHHYWVTGHLHHLSVSEKNGVTIIKCPSLTFADRWHTDKGFIGSRRSLMILRFDKTGMKEIYFANP